MNNNPRQPFDELSELNLRMRAHLEHAEMVVPPLNQQIEQLARLSWLAPTALIGDIVATRPYAAGTGQHDSCQILRAALLIPGGFGLAVLDLEDDLDWAMQPDVAFQEVHWCFVPFEKCHPPERALLFPQSAPLLRQLHKLILSASRGFETPRWADERPADNSST